MATRCMPGAFFVKVEAVPTPKRCAITYQRAADSPWIGRVVSGRQEKPHVARVTIESRCGRHSTFLTGA